jgi:predicted permease
MTDMKYAFRSLFKSPGFTIAAIFTIAIGIGANTALFSIFNTLVLSPIALPDAGRLVRIWTNNKQRNVAGPVLSVPKYRMFAEQQTVFSDISAAAFNSFILTRDGADPEQLSGLNVTASFVPTLGMPLVRGRNFTADEDKQNGPHVCILTYDVWKTRFGKREDLVGSTIQLDGVGTTVVGILAEGTPAPISFVQVLLPWPFNPTYLNDQQLEGGAGFMQVTARLKPGVTLEKAQAEVASISKRYQQEFPGRLDGTNENELRTWVEEQVGPVRPTFILLLTAVGFVLLIACANVSNLFLSRLTARHKEIAVRLSLGATRRHLVRQFLLESLIFCVFAATLGVGLATWSLHAAERVFTKQLQAPTTFSLDALTLAFTVGLSVLSSFAIGFIPAMQASNVNLADVLKDSARGTIGGARGTRFRGFLIVAEVSLSVVLLIGSSLLLVSFAKLQSTPAGFSTRGIASAFVNPAPERYPTRVEKVNFYYQVLDKLRSNPQVKFAAVTQGLPLTGNNMRGVYSVFGRPLPPLAERPIAYLDVATEDYFAMMGIPLKSGRLFQATDIDTSPLVCVINESFARKLFPNENPLGQFIVIGQQGQTKMEIVGIVGDVKANGLNTPPPETIYNSLRQIGGTAGQSIVASTVGDPNLLQPLLRAAVASVDRSLAVSAFATMDTQVAQSLGVQRVTAWLTGAFAAVALLLSALGLYSVLAYAVTQRTGEIGIRMALGAERGDVIRLVLSQGMRLVAVGLVVGLSVAAVGGRALTSLLYDVEPLNPAVFGGVTVLFTFVAIAACLVPSWRASRIEALVALRSE